MMHVATTTVASPDWLRVLADCDQQPQDYAWLDSAVGDPDRGRESLLALAQQPAVAVYNDRVVLYDEQGRSTVLARPKRVFLWLESWYRRQLRHLPPDAPGWVGWVAWEAQHLADAAMPDRGDDLPIPLIRIDRVNVALRQQGDHCTLVAVGVDQVAADAALCHAQQRLARVHAEGAPLPAPAPLQLIEDADPARHAAGVEHLLRAIHAGVLYQGCLTHGVFFARPPTLAPLYGALRTHNPGDYGACLRMGDYALASVSPERFLDVDGDQVVARPMKGTRPRHPATEDADAVALHHSAKDRAENVMIVDLLRNDLGRVCVAGTVQVPTLFAVERYATVLQMTSTVRGTLRPDVGPFTLLEAAFPPGSMSGAPKVEACRQLARLEPSIRGLYGGTLGWWTPDGRARFGVVIRGLQAWANLARWDVGGGIVADSDAAAEWDETRTKLAALWPFVGV